MSNRKRSRDERTDKDFARSVQEARGAELQTVLLETLRYDQQAFQQQKVFRLKDFAAQMLEQLYVTWPEFVALQPNVQRACVAAIAFPPPSGATEYFKVR